MPPILYLIDGHALAYRTYFALMSAGGERFHTRSGELTAGVYGFSSVLLRILEQERPEYLAVAFDTGKTFRDDLYPAYKATRAKMPDELRSQIERIRQVVDAFHFPRLEVEGFEADDILGTVARQAVEQGFGVKIITGDRDLLQLVDDRIMINLTGNKLSEAKDYQEKDVVANLGILPAQVVDYKAMAGDHSDNIPGVPGIGEKTAVSLLQKYGSLDEIYNHLPEIPERFKNKLESGRDSAYLSQQLARIRTDIPVKLTLEDARTDHINLSAVEELFRQLEFRTLVDRLHSSGKAVGVPSTTQQLALFGREVTQISVSGSYSPEVGVISTPEALQKLLEKLDKADRIALDTETTSTSPLSASLVGISLAVQEGEGFYIPLGHKTGEPQLPIEKTIAELAPFLANPKKRIIGHNLKFDSLVLMKQGLTPKPLSFDTMIAEWLVDPASHRLGLKDMAEEFLNLKMTHITELIGKGKNQLTMADIPVETAASYAASDAEVTFRLVPILEKRLEDHKVSHLFHEIEMPLISVLAQMEFTGIKLDVPFFQKMAGELNHRLIEIDQQVMKVVGYRFNLNSTQQLSKALFESLQLEPPDRKQKTASGHYSTSADVLEELRGKHRVVDSILEYRELAKLKSTYVDALPQQINPATNRVHTSFSQTGSVTGRLASSEPNLQNIPTRTEIGRKVREGFIADPEMVLLSVDYSQIELRIVAHMSGDDAMLAAFQSGRDIHATTAAAIYNIPLEQVSKDQRRHSKAINFGLIYGMSAFGLTRTTDLTLAEAEDFVKAYFHEFPGVKKYLDGMRQTAARQGYVETLLGRRRYFPGLHSQTNNNIRNREEREAINAPIQGTAADIMKLAMIHLPGKLSQAGLKTRLLLQVHDELVLECPDTELNRAVQVVRDTMEHAYEISVPLLTEASYGINWGNLKPIS